MMALSEALYRTSASVEVVAAIIFLAAETEVCLIALQCCPAVLRMSSSTAVLCPCTSYSPPRFSVASMVLTIMVWGFHGRVCIIIVALMRRYGGMQDCSTLRSLPWDRCSPPSMQNAECRDDVDLLLEVSRVVAYALHVIHI